MLTKLQSELQTTNKDIVVMIEALVDIYQKHYDYLAGAQTSKHFEELKDKLKKITKTNRKTNQHILRLIALYNPNSINLTQAFIYTKANFALAQIIHQTKTILKESKVNFDMDIGKDELLFVHKGTMEILRIAGGAIGLIEEPSKAMPMLEMLEQKIKSNQKSYKALEKKILKNMKNNNKDVTNEFQALLYLRDLLEVDRDCLLVLKDISNNASRL